MQYPKADSKNIIHERKKIYKKIQKGNIQKTVLNSILIISPNWFPYVFAKISLYSNAHYRLNDSQIKFFLKGEHVTYACIGAICIALWGLSGSEHVCYHWNTCRGRPWLQGLNTIKWSARDLPGDTFCWTPCWGLAFCSTCREKALETTGS